MKTKNFTEVNAVVTHPDHIGQGLAKNLIAYTSNRIFLENKILYLHVAEPNTDAIKLDEKLGFVTRRKISFWNFIKTECLAFFKDFYYIWSTRIYSGLCKNKKLYF